MMRIEQVYSRRETIAFIMLAALMAILVFVLNLGVKGPMIQADEGSYLANAAAIAGFHNDMASSYYAGYSILITPAFWLADTPHGIWTFVKLINALLFGWIVLLLWRISQLFSPEPNLKTRLRGVALVSIYPMWGVMVGYSFPQIAVVPFFLLVVLVFIRSVRGGVVTWLWLGIISGFLYWIHPTALAILISVGIGSAYIAWVRGCSSSLLILLSSMAVMVIAYRQGVTPWLHDQMTISGHPPNLHYPSLSRMLSPLLTFEGIKEIVARTGGHIFYLSVGTVGLIWVGLISLSARAIHVQNRSDADTALTNRAVAIFLILALAGTLALSVLLFSSTPAAKRLDHWMYGRYVEGVIAPILLAGALTGSLRTGGLWTILIAVFGANLLAMNLDSYTHIARFNVSAFWQDFWLREQGLWSWLVAGCVLIGLAASLPRRMGIFVIFSVFAYSSYLQIIWHQAAAKDAAKRWDAALIVREKFSPGTCVGFDHSGINSYNKHIFWFDFGFQLYDYQLKRMSFERWLEDCEGPLFSYSKDLDERSFDVYPLALSPHSGPVGPMLWVKGRPHENNVYTISVADRSPALMRVLGAGWYDLEHAHVWSGREAQLRLPVPDDCHAASVCRVKLRFSVYGASASRPVNVDIREVGQKITTSQSLTIRTPAQQEIILPLNASAAIQRLLIKIPDAVSPKELQGSTDPRVLGMALRSIELVRQKGIRQSGFSADTLTQVGVLRDNQLFSDGRRGFLLFGPYRPMNAGHYRLVIHGAGIMTDTAWIDVVSAKGTVQHAKFAMSPIREGDAMVLVQGFVTLESPVEDIEIRVFVGEQDIIRLDGYELVLVENFSDEIPAAP